jgi:hypothetical protein
VNFFNKGRRPAQPGIVMPEDRQPPTEPAGLAIQLVFTTVNNSLQTAAAVGTNVTVSGPGAGPVAVADGQAVQAGRDAAAARAVHQPSREGWWTRLRKRGAVVAFSTIVGAIAVVVGTAVAICAWAGWTP